VTSTWRRAAALAAASPSTPPVAAINAWNRLSIAARIVPGAYKPAKVAS
jgi:hypothetical protein